MDHRTATRPQQRPTMTVTEAAELCRRDLATDYTRSVREILTAWAQRAGVDYESFRLEILRRL